MTSSGPSRAMSTSVLPVRWSSPMTTSPGRSPSSEVSRITAKPNISSREIGETWLNYIVENRAILWWGGNGNSTEHTAWLNLKRGIEAPESGSIAVNGQAVAEQIGAQIFIDGWAIRWRREIRLSQRASQPAGGQGSVTTGRRWTLQNCGRRWRPRPSYRETSKGSSTLALRKFRPRARSRSLSQISAVSRRQYSDWRDARQAIEARYGYDKYPGNCHIVPNHALMIMALLYAPVDFSRAQTIVCTSGWIQILQRGQCRLSDGCDARPQGDRGGSRLAWAYRRPHAHFLG